MTHTLSKTEQADLMAALRQPVVRKALAEALGIIQSEKSGASTLESAAMAYNHLEGASGLVGKLYAMAEIPDEKPIVAPKRFRAITN